MARAKRAWQNLRDRPAAERSFSALKRQHPQLATDVATLAKLVRPNLLSRLWKPAVTASVVATATGAATGSVRLAIAAGAGSLVASGAMGGAKALSARARLNRGLIRLGIKQGISIPEKTVKLFERTGVILGPDHP